MKNLYFDIETFSSVDLKTCGVYKYTESIDFEILIIAYSVDRAPTQVCNWLDLPAEIRAMFTDPNVMKHAHNAMFERLCLRAVGIVVPYEQWRCSAVKAAYCGLPMALGQLSLALNLKEEGKLSTGAALIRYFSCPVKPTKANGGRTRNFQHHNPVKWTEYQTYCIGDVVSEMKVDEKLSIYDMPASEWEAYALDQMINDRGILIDTELAEKAIEIDNTNTEQFNKRTKEITGLDNPNSLAQLRTWIGGRLQKTILSLAKEAIETILEDLKDEAVREVLEIRQQTGRTSTKKYVAMIACAGEDLRARGLFQFYGAGRTGRWAGRLIQLQNLRRNSIKDLNSARALVRAGDFDTFDMIYDVSDTLSQLIRTALIPAEGKLFGVSDFSAIEARVIAWLAGESWRMEVFRTHGKIYEASAAKMFSVPIESISYEDTLGETHKGPNYEMRAKGKVAELALGYQGSLGALTKMGGDKMGLSDVEMSNIVKVWRDANPSIVQLWKNFEELAVNAVKYKAKYSHAETGIVFWGTQQSLRVKLPSGRELIYWNAILERNKFGKDAIKYKGLDQITRQWFWVDTYGGKITENIVQAVARDLLLESMQAVTNLGFAIVAHIHDEIICEIESASDLEKITAAMGVPPEWAKDLPLGAEGYVCDFYKKD